MGVLELIKIFYLVIILFHIYVWYFVFLSRRERLD